MNKTNKSRVKFGPGTNPVVVLHLTRGGGGGVSKILLIASALAVVATRLINTCVLIEDRWRETQDIFLF